VQVARDNKKNSIPKGVLRGADVDTDCGPRRGGGAREKGNVRETGGTRRGGANETENRAVVQACCNYEGRGAPWRTLLVRKRNISRCAQRFNPREIANVGRDRSRATIDGLMDGCDSRARGFPKSHFPSGGIRNFAIPRHAENGIPAFQITSAHRRQFASGI